MTAHWSRTYRVFDDVLPASTDGDGDPIHHVAKLDSLDRQAQARITVKPQPVSRAGCSLARVQVGNDEIPLSSSAI